MKKSLVLLLSIAVTAAIATAQRHETAQDRDVHITSGPEVRNVSPTAATVVWSTDKNSANDVHYAREGGREKVAYDRGGSTNHAVTLTGLRPGSNYKFKIMNRDGTVRTAGEFHTPR